MVMPLLMGAIVEKVGQANVVIKVISSCYVNDERLGHVQLTSNNYIMKHRIELH